MGYDLTFRPRKGRLTEDAFVEYFNDRAHYSFPDEDPNCAAYFSNQTNVYFHFRYQAPDRDEPRGALSFAINFYRPHVFALEAEPELADLVEALDLAVDDYQTGGIEGDTYDGEAFLRGWNQGNQLAHEAVLTREDDPADPPFTLPREDLERIWRWSHELEQTEEENGSYYLAPPIGFVNHAGRLATIVSWPQEQQILLPRTDLVYVTRGRDEKKESRFVRWRDLEEEITFLQTDPIPDPWDYWALAVTDIGTRLNRFFQEKQGPQAIDTIEIDQVHAREDVEPYLARRAPSLLRQARE